MIQSGDSNPPVMEEEILGVTIAARDGFGRIFELGDRSSPLAFTPALVTMPSDIKMDLNMAPFEVNIDSSSLPANLKFTGKDAFAIPFEKKGPTWSTELIHVLPPSFDEVNMGNSGPIGRILPLTWQRILYDSQLLDESYQPQIVVLLDALQLSNRPKDFTKAIFEIRTRYPGALIWCPGISGPDNLAVLTWLGIDLHDLTRSRQANSSGIILSNSGPRNIDHRLEENPTMDEQICMWKDEIAAVRSAIVSGNLRDLVEKRALNSPRTVEHLRFHDNLVFDSGNVPLERNVSKGRVLRCNSLTALESPLIRDWNEKVIDVYEPPSFARKILVLLPCSQRKPYRTSKSHRKYISALRNLPVNQVMVTSPLGLVPRELEMQWPAKYYDIPVTGDWNLLEISNIRNMVGKLVNKVGYKFVINHTRINLDDLNVSAKIIDSSYEDEGLTSKSSLDNLSKIAKSAVAECGGVSIRQHENVMAEFRCISNWLFGSDSWLNECKLSGRPPNWILRSEGEQVAIWNCDVARFSFSKYAIEKFGDKLGLPKVNIVTNSKWKGDIFSSMVKDFDTNIRSGDTILVYSNDEIIGSAISIVPSWEWNGSPGKLAKARHRI